MEFTTLLFDVRDAVGYITLNRPEAANSINIDMARELMYAVLTCDEDSGVRAVLIAGSGSTFCAGGDLKSFAIQGERLHYYLKELTTYLHAALSRLARLDLPVVAAVQGSAAGAGMSLALACDLVIAGESARFTTAYTARGLAPDGSLTFFLPRAVGLKRALELTLTGRVLSAYEGLYYGFVSRVVPDTELQAEAKLTAARLANGPTRALAAVKRLLYAGSTETLETQMEQESEAIVETARTADGREGIGAFLEKRRPNFRGC